MPHAARWETSDSVKQHKHAQKLKSAQVPMSSVGFRLYIYYYPESTWGDTKRTGTLPSTLELDESHANICPCISMHCHPNMQTSVRTKNMQLPDKQIFQIVRTHSGLDRSYLIQVHFCFLFGKKQARRMLSLDTKDFNCEAAMPNLKCSCGAENT